MKNNVMRFIVHPDSKECLWRHFLELEGFDEWVDCTEMNDDEFHDFMVSGNSATQTNTGVNKWKN